MQTPSFKLVRRVTVYLVGLFLIGWGLCGFTCEFLLPEQNATNYVYAPNMFCGVVICWGALLILATHRHYAGGVWTFLGATFAGISMIFGALAVDTYLMDSRFRILVTSLVIVAIVLQASCYSLVAGHVRHKRKRTESPPNTSLEATATAHRVSTMR